MRIHVGRAKTEGPLGSEKQGSPSDLPGEKIQKNRLIRGTDRNFRILTFWALFWPILDLPPWATKQMRLAQMAWRNAKTGRRLVRFKAIRPPEGATGRVEQTISDNCDICRYLTELRLIRRSFHPKPR